MGFGLIFSGWSTLLFFKVIPIGVIGCLLMLKGLLMLEGYNKYFVYAKRACYVLSVCFVVYTVFWILDFVNILPFGDVFTTIDGIVYCSSFCVFSYFLYKALGDISRLVGFDKGIKREQRATSLLIVFVLFTLIKLVLTPFELSKYLSYPLIALEIILLLYTCIYLYSCYMMIATQEIIDYENKKIREYDEKHYFRTKKNNKSK